MSTTQQPKIDKKFAALIPPLRAEERAELERSILREGCRDALVVWQEEGLLLDGHNRLAICQQHGVAFKVRTLSLPSRDAAEDWIDTNQLARRNVTDDQRSAMALRVVQRRSKMARSAQAADAINTRWKGKQGSGYVEDNVASTNAKKKPRTRAAVAAEFKVPERKLRAVATIARQDPKAVDDIIAGKTTIAKAKKKVRAEQAERDLDAAQKKVDAAKRSRIESVCDLRVCTCAELFASGVRPDAVITDPPYEAAYLPAFSELAEGCKAAGVPLVAVMSGQTYLPEVMRRLCEHLHYRWTLAYLTPGGQAVQQWKAKVNTAWKPVLLFGEAVEWFGDVAVSKPNDNDKRFHDWGQSESGMADLVERLSKPGQLVCDPFLGGGTTAVVALALGRRFVGCDISSRNVEKAKARVLR